MADTKSRVVHSSSSPCRRRACRPGLEGADKDLLVEAGCRLLSEGGVSAPPKTFTDFRKRVYRLGRSTALWKRSVRSR